MIKAVTGRAVQSLTMMQMPTMTTPHEGQSMIA